ncbi:hypothetical protein [Companilactobacillus mishanensis]|uniref:Uncharacterized protein n=1 Tax=Companilactobacillus mishanensis TaxID=2486008 RepID=A0ABW9P9C9_9LACO|nr:hypothetical protein [Companilactobacillus mishanensis]MQS45823.1 hypothetical protein [Companilactobacillus mishanensis]
MKNKKSVFNFAYFVSYFICSLIILNILEPIRRLLDLYLHGTIFNIINGLIIMLLFLLAGYISLLVSSKFTKSK